LFPRVVFFFIIIGETSHLSIPDSYALQVTKAMPTDIPPRDWTMARFMTMEVGVCAIPPSAFYSLRTLSLAANTLRFAFCKKEDTFSKLVHDLGNILVDCSCTILLCLVAMLYYILRIIIITCATESIALLKKNIFIFLFQDS